MAVAGDFGALRRMIQKVSPENTRAMMPRVAQRVAATADKLVGDEFAQSRDPYGNPWEPLKYRRGQPLLKTARMARSRSAQWSGSGVVVTIGAGYAKYHQDGTKPHARAGAAIPQSRRGKFVSKRKASVTKGRVQKVAVFGAYEHGGIPRRQMLPALSTGGLGPVWYAAIAKDSRDVMRATFGGA